MQYLGNGIGTIGTNSTPKDTYLVEKSKSFSNKVYFLHLKLFGLL